MKKRSRIHRSGYCPVFREKQDEMHALAERQAWPWALKKNG